MGFFTEDTPAVEVKATFPPSNPLGVIVNGEQNKLFLNFINSGRENFTILNAGASYHDPENHWALVRNVSTLKYNAPLPGEANYSLPFTMHSEFRPREIGVTVWANLKSSSTGEIHRFVAMNGTANVVEQESGWFDVKLLFLYLVLGALLSTAGYYIYESFIKPYFSPPTTKRGSKKTGASRKTVVPAEVSSKGYPASVQPYEEEWIPEHLKNGGGGVRKRKSGRVAGEVASGTDTGAATSGGEVTSGAETSGTERKGKGKGGKKGGRT